jgi:hypothetical protein
MARFAAVKHQRTVELARDMGAAAGKVVKLRNRARWDKRDPTELRAAELGIREKCGLLEDYAAVRADAARNAAEGW